MCTRTFDSEHPVQSKVLRTSKKHVLHLAHDMAVGGTQQVIKQLISSLNSDEFECSVVCIDGVVGLIGEQLRKEGIQIIVLERRPGFDLELVKKIRTLIRENAIDILHCHQYTPYSYGVLASIYTTARVVFTEHGRFYPDSYSWKRRFANALLQRRTAGTVAISKATADALVEFEWFSRSAIDVIYNGIRFCQPEKASDEVRYDLGICVDALIFGTIARFDKIKNLPMMVKAFGIVIAQYPNAKLLMVGDGDQRQKLESIVVELGLKNSVIFTGFQSDTAKYMTTIDVYLLTSFSEGTSMTLLESMALSKPSIVTGVGGNIEIVEDRRNGLVVESDDAQQLAAGMLTLAGDAGLRERLGKQARQIYEQKFSISSMAAQYYALYKRCV